MGKIGKMGKDDSKDVIGSGEVSKILRVSRRTVSKWAKEGNLPTLPPYYPGTHARFDRDQITKEATKLSSQKSSTSMGNKTSKREDKYLQVNSMVTVAVDQGKLFNISIPNNAVWIHSIEIIPSKSIGQFEFLLWDQQQEADYDQKLEDLIYQSDSDGQRIIYQPANLYFYEDRNNSKLLHCGIAVFERNTRFDVTTEALKARLVNEFKFDFNIRCIFKLP